MKLRKIVPVGLHAGEHQEKREEEPGG